MRIMRGLKKEKKDDNDFFVFCYLFIYLFLVVFFEKQRTMTRLL